MGRYDEVTHVDPIFFKWSFGSALNGGSQANVVPSSSDGGGGLSKWDKDDEAFECMQASSMAVAERQKGSQ